MVNIFQITSFLEIASIHFNRDCLVIPKKSRTKNSVDFSDYHITFVKAIKMLIYWCSYLHVK